VNILIGCNKSRREAVEFEKRGHRAVTCDLLPAEQPGEHIQDDVSNHLNDGWDMAIFNPDCTHLANSGVRWLHERPERWEMMIKSCEFFNKLLKAPIPKIAVENPIQHKYARQLIRKYDQKIQPYYFGDDASKSTCLWLKGLPKLKPTNFINPHYRCRCGYRFEYELGKYGCPNCCGEGIARLVFGNQTPSGQNNEPPGANQKANRARTYQGISQAMAEQWG
jgi:hypothetical protein